MTHHVVTRLLASALLAALTGSAAAQSTPPPNPVLYLSGMEFYTAGGKDWVRYRFDVLNKDAYAPEMFNAAPRLPPCGNNASASRSWVDIFDSRGKRLYGFCALGKPADLGTIWFAV